MLDPTTTPSQDTAGTLRAPWIVAVACAGGRSFDGRYSINITPK